MHGRSCSRFSVNGERSFRSLETNVFTHAKAKHAERGVDVEKDRRRGADPASDLKTLGALWLEMQRRLAAMPGTASTGFEAAFEPEAIAWLRLRTTLSRRSNVATLSLERDWRIIRSFDPTGNPAPRPIAAIPVSITPPLRISRTASHAPPGFVSF